MASSSKKLLKELPTDKAMMDTLIGLMDASDQGVALTGAAYLDHVLQVLLTAYFRVLTTEERSRMFDGSANGILGATTAKIRLAYAMSLLGPLEYRDLLLINDIRNVFAHTLHHISFANELVADDCATLRSWEGSGLQPPANTSKDKYLWSVINLYHRLPRSRALL